MFTRIVQDPRLPKDFLIIRSGKNSNVVVVSELPTWIFACNQGIAGVHEGQAYAWQTLACPGIILYALLSSKIR
jgi:hypothetical protein